MSEGVGCSMNGARISYVHTCSRVYGHWLYFCSSAFTCSVNAVFKFSNRMPLIY